MCFTFKVILTKNFCWKSSIGRVVMSMKYIWPFDFWLAATYKNQVKVALLRIYILACILRTSDYYLHEWYCMTRREVMAAPPQTWSLHCDSRGRQIPELIFHFSQNMKCDNPRLVWPLSDLWPWPYRCNLYLPEK